jgi:hypothetical protein
VKRSATNPPSFLHTHTVAPLLLLLKIEKITNARLFIIVNLITYNTIFYATFKIDDDDDERERVGNSSGSWETWRCWLQCVFLCSPHFTRVILCFLSLSLAAAAATAVCKKVDAIRNGFGTMSPKSHDLSRHATSFVRLLMLMTGIIRDTSRAVGAMWRNYLMTSVSWRRFESWKIKQ